MLRSLGLVVIIALAGGCATQPMSSHATASQASAKAKSEKVADWRDPNAVRCEYIDKTGTRFGTRVCMKNSEWKAYWKRTSSGSREALDQAERIGAQVDAGNGNGQ